MVRTVINATVRRGDGAATRRRILLAAGRVFAEKGYDRTTGREISLRARCNSAAVNYHFGGIDGLYVEVLIEAHRRLVTIDRLHAIAEGRGDGRARLLAIIGLFAETALAPSRTSWALRVLGRELMAPSAALPEMVERELLPKKRIVTTLVGECLGLSSEHPLVAATCVQLVAPFLLLLLGDRGMLAEVFPPLRAPVVEPALLARHFQAMAAGALDSAARQAASPRGHIAAAQASARRNPVAT